MKMGDKATQRGEDVADDNEESGVGIFTGHLFNMDHIVTFAKYCPLATAILAPLATLMDIPALTQRWYTKDGVTQPDPKASLALSAVGLALNVIANVLLIMRFSSRTTKWIRQTVHWSLICWIAKTVIAIVNLVVYGIYYGRRGGIDGYVYTEGFWCAVVSVCVAGIISLALLVHFCFAFNKPDEDTIAVRLSGRKFMLSVTAFMSILAIQALVFSRIENWSYADGIYFSIQTALTIGYGDFVPENAAGKVLVFPFAILTISQLGNEISLIVAFIRERSRERRRVWRKKYEGAIHREAEMLKPNASLVEEMRLVHEINKREEWMSQMLDLIWSAISLLAFWLIGAVIFSALEGWSYGNAVYACIITSVTIGFGDYTPETAAGRVYFIPFVLLAVPIVTSFAVQTITGLLSTFSNRTHTTTAVRQAARYGADWCRPHEELVKHHRSIYTRLGQILTLHPDSDQARDRDASKPPLIGSKADTDDREGHTDAHTHGYGYSPDDTSDAAQLAKQRVLVKQLLDRVIKLETQSRQLLLDNLEHGVARTLLVADRNVQARSVGETRDLAFSNTQPTPLDTVLAEHMRTKDHTVIADDEQEDSEGPGADETLQEVEKYRSLFAEILVLGSTIQHLDGQERATFERRLHVNGPSSGDSITVASKEEQGQRPRMGDEAQADLEGKGLTGMTKVLYRQHAKKLRRVYTVA